MAVPLIFDEDLIGVITCLRVDDQQGVINQFFPTDISHQVMKLLAGELAEQLWSRLQLGARKQIFESMEKLMKRLPDLSLCKSEHELYTELHHIIGEELPQGEKYFSILESYVEGDSEVRLHMTDASRSVLAKKSRGNEPPTFGINDGLTGALLGSDTDFIYQPFVEAANGAKSECKLFWNTVVGSEKRYFYGRSISYDDGVQQKTVVIVINGERPKTFHEKQFNDVLDKLSEQLSQQLKKELIRINTPSSNLLVSPSLEISIFISYPSQREDFAKDLYGVLKHCGYNPKMDSYGGIESGDNIAEKLKNMMIESDLAIVLLTPEVSNSVWITSEIATAHALNKKIFPVELEELSDEDANKIVVIPRNTTNWYKPDKGMTGLIDNIKKVLKKSDISNNA